MADRVHWPDTNTARALQFVRFVAAGGVSIHLFGVLFSWQHLLRTPRAVQRAQHALGGTRSAKVSPEEHQSVAKIGRLLWRDLFAKLSFYQYRIGTAAKTQSIGNADAMGICNNGGTMLYIAEN